MAKDRSGAGTGEMEGPLAPFAADYTSRLRRSGYTASTMAKLLQQATHLSRWMQSSKLGAADLTTEHIEAFLSARRATKGARSCSFQGLVPLREVLAEQGMLAMAEALTTTPTRRSFASGPTCWRNEGSLPAPPTPTCGVPTVSSPGSPGIAA